MDLVATGTNTLLGTPWPLLLMFIVCCMLIGYFVLVVIPKAKDAKSISDLDAKFTTALEEITKLKAILESVDNKSIGKEITAEIRISIEEIKAIADTISRTSDVIFRLESNLHDFNHTNDDTHRDMYRVVQELHRQIADMNSRMLFISHSLCSSRNPEGFNLNGIS